MSHLRDIQKLRQSRNSNHIGMNHRFSQPQTQDIYNVDINPQMTNSDPRPHIGYQKQSYNKFLQSKQIIPQIKEKKNSLHKRGLSNGSTYCDNKNPASLSSRENYTSSGPGPNIDNYGTGINSNTGQLMQFVEDNLRYNRSMKLGINRTPNPLTTRRDRKEDYLQFQSAFDLKQRKPSRQSIRQSLQVKNVSRSDFETLYPIGKGGFGKVWKVQHKKNKQVYALKEMFKAKIIQKKSINSVMNERKLLSTLSHPFIINMSYAFQDRENLYLIMDYLDGGDLRYHIGRRGRFTQIQTKFFICNLIIGLDYMHKNNIIHRDIKPENLVFEKNGYLRITDMGISRQFKNQNHTDTSGTPGYMAPEVMVRKNHGFPVDFFAVGVMGYEFMMGRRPYLGKNRKEIRDQILAKQAGIRQDDLPRRWSIEAADFINKLLIRNPANRLGTQGTDQLKQHPWLSSVDWKKLQKKQLRAPYIPVSIEEDYQDYKEQISEDTIDENEEQNKLMLRDSEVQSLFNGYQFDKHQKLGMPPSLQRVKQRSTSYTTNCTESQIKELKQLKLDIKDFRDSKTDHSRK